MAVPPYNQAYKQVSVPPPTPKIKSKIVLLIIIAIVIIGIFWLFLRWQTGRDKQEGVREVGADANKIQILENGTSELTRDGLGENSAKTMTPEEKFASAEIIDIQNGDHDSTVDNLGVTIKAVFGEYKITGYTQGYMGMNSGSGIVQYTFAKTLSLENADILKQKMEESGYTDIVVDKQTESVNLQAKKNNYKYRLSFNQGDQEITVIIENINK